MGQDLGSRLGKLTDLCERQRADGRGRPRYCEKTKALVRDLSMAGVGAAALASAAGVSASAIRSWLLDDPVEASALKGVKVLEVEGASDGPDPRRMILMVRAADYEVAVYARGRGQS